VNSRLDELQAAVLRARLPRLRAWTDRRRHLAASYRRLLANPSVAVPASLDAGHVYHLFVVRSARRAALQRHLAERGIDTLVHYPMPISRQPALATAPPAQCPIAERACDEVLSLPLYPGLGDRDAADVAAAVNAFNSKD
jgi:dTDP-4-amino-4,6-dideoxygalactose transaminase